MKIIFYLLLCINLFGDTLHVASAKWPPYIEKKEKQISGISVDIIKEIAKRTGDKIDIRIYPVKRLQRLLKYKKIDINFADAKEWNSKEEQKKYVFSEPYLYVNEYIYSTPNFNKVITKVSDLYGEKVGITKGYYYEILEKDFNNKKILKYEITTNKGLLKLLLRDKFSLAIFDDKLLDYLLKGKKSDMKLIQKMEVSSVALRLKILNSKKNILPRINKAIESMKKDHTIDAILAKYKTSK